MTLNLLLTTFNAEAAELVVPTGYGSIGAAVENAEPHDTIIVEDGHYKENIVIDKPVALVSRNGYEKTTIEAKDEEKDVLKVVGSEGVSVVGFTFRGSALSGVYLRKTKDSNISNNSLTGNYNGIFLEYSSRNRLRENSSRENMQGIYLYYSDENLLESNMADKNLDKGIVLHASHGNMIRDNTADGNYWNGITLTSSHKNTIIGNSAVSNSYAIVMAESRENDLAGNSTRRRLHFLLPLALIYLGITFYLIQRRLLLGSFKSDSR